MSQSSDAQQARKRALVIPREHGAWGLLLVPLFTGAVTGLAAGHRIVPLMLVTLCALSLFWLRTPLEGLLGTSVLKATTKEERSISLLASILLASIAATCLVALIWKGSNRWLLPFGAAAAFAILLQAAMQKLGRSARMPAQLLGALGLTCTAPAAYYVAAGKLDARAFILWAANWIFAGNQIHFVQLRIHSARAIGFAQKFAQGRYFFLAQPVLLIVLIIASLRRLLPSLAIIAFIPALVRGALWFFQTPRALDLKRLGWGEMVHGITFGLLLSLAFIYS
jgi:YwiC-like protein